jgi:hypothetical protein
VTQHDQGKLQGAGDKPISAEQMELARLRAQCARLKISTLYQSGVRDLREHFTEIEAQKSIAIETKKEEVAAAKAAEEL